MERGLRPWLDNDLLFNLTALGRENRQCVKVLHDFTNQVGCRLDHTDVLWQMPKKIDDRVTLPSFSTMSQIGIFTLTMRF